MATFVYGNNTKAGEVFTATDPSMIKDASGATEVYIQNVGDNPIMVSWWEDCNYHNSMSPGGHGFPAGFILRPYEGMKLFKKSEIYFDTANGQYPVKLCVTMYEP